MSMYPWTRMVQKLHVGMDLKLDRTTYIALSTLIVLCGTVAATTTDSLTTQAATTVTATATAETATTETATAGTTTSRTTVELTSESTSTQNAQTTVVATTTGSKLPTATGTAAAPSTVDGDNTQSTSMTTMTGSSGMETGTDGDSVSTADSGTTSGVTSSPPIKCFTCETNDTMSSCYGDQSSAPQPNMTCNAGEKCWTFWYGNGATFLNLTRGCHLDPCGDMHETADSSYCKETNSLQQCTQCCDQDLCNEHINEGVKNGGNGVSGCLTTLVLSVVMLMIML